MEGRKIFRPSDGSIPRERWKSFRGSVRKAPLRLVKDLAAPPPYGLYGLSRAASFICQCRSTMVMAQYSSE